METETRLEKTIQMLGQKYNYFDINERMMITPLSKMLFTVKAFCHCLDEESTKEHNKELTKIYDNPIRYVLEKHPDCFSDKRKARINIGKTLGQLEWIFFRDSHKFTPLKKEYFIDSSKPKTTKSVTFDDISAIR